MATCPSCRATFAKEVEICPTDGTPLTDPMIGQTLAGRYRLLGRIGEGGMGTVYEATHIQLGKNVAVKVLREKHVDRSEVASRMVQEARVASSLRHQNIVDITDFGTTDDGRTFVVMEMLAGETLAERLKRDGPLDEVRAIEIVRQVASALGAAHDRGVIHRDIKPENIFLVERTGVDFVKVVDFGLSKMLNEVEGAQAPRLTQTGQVLGTPLYMSPEQGRGEEDLDHRIDIYALGVILFECLTGEVPFRGATQLGIISQVLTQEPPRPRALRPELRISEASERVVLKAMAKSRHDRYPTMSEFEADLIRAREGERVAPPVSHQTASSSGRAVRVMGAVALLLFGSAALVLASRAGRPPLAASDRGPAEPPPPAAARAQAPPMVTLRVESSPPGAEVRLGDRIFGPAPRELRLARSQVPARLTFHLDGYEDAAAEVVPATDDLIQVKLTPRARTRHNRSARTQAPALPSPAAPRKTGETLPNPY